MKHVNGIDNGKIMLYAISTCAWCGKTKALLNELKVAYSYEDVDLLPEKEKEELTKEIEKKYNHEGTFPTMVINDKKVIVGFKEEEIRKWLSKSKKAK